MGMIDPRDCYFLVHSYPDKFLHSELARWLIALGVPLNQWRVWPCKDISRQCTYNAALKWLLRSRPKYNQFVVMDCDIQPHEARMADFWSSPADIVGVRYEGAPSGPDFVHSALWRTSRHALEAVRDKFGTWFQWEFNEDETQTTACLCKSLVVKAWKLGLSVEQGGYAIHTPRR